MWQGSLKQRSTFDYWMWQPPTGPGGGFVGLEPTASAKINQPLIYIGPGAIEANLKDIEAAGGTTVTPKMKIPGPGGFAVFTDSAGNQMAFYTALNPGQ